MLRWSRRSIHRTTRAAARCTISSRCNSVPVIPNNAAFPKSSVDVTRRAQAFYMLRAAEMIVCALYFVVDRMQCRIHE